LTTGAAKPKAALFKLFKSTAFDFSYLFAVTLTVFKNGAYFFQFFSSIPRGILF
jgi:hypothetical protein